MQAIDRSRSGRTTNIHALCDEQGRPYALLTAGLVMDIQGARALLGIANPPGTLIGDKAYNANDVRAYLAAQGSTAVISPMPRRTNPCHSTSKPTRPATSSNGRSND